MSWRSVEIRRVGMSVVIRLSCMGSWWGLVQLDRIVPVGGRVVVIAADLLFGGDVEKGDWASWARGGSCSRVALRAALSMPATRQEVQKMIKASGLWT